MAVEAKAVNGGVAVPLGGPQEVPSEPVFKTPELARQWEKLKKLMAANEAKAAECTAKARQYGGQFNIPSEELEKLRFRALVDVLLPAGTEEGQQARLDMDFLVQERLADMLGQALAGMAQAALQAGAMLPPEQMDALVRQQAPGLARAQERRSR